MRRIAISLLAALLLTCATVGLMNLAAKAVGTHNMPRLHASPVVCPPVSPTDQGLEDFGVRFSNETTPRREG